MVQLHLFLELLLQMSFQWLQYLMKTILYVGVVHLELLYWTFDWHYYSQMKKMLKKAASALPRQMKTQLMFHPSPTHSQVCQIEKAFGQSYYCYYCQMKTLAFGPLPSRQSKEPFLPIIIYLPIMYHTVWIPARFFQSYRRVQKKFFFLNLLICTLYTACVVALFTLLVLFHSLHCLCCCTLYTVCVVVLFYH